MAVLVFSYSPSAHPIVLVLDLEHVWQRFLERFSSRREYRLEAYATLGRQQCSIGFQPVSDAAYAA
jgi:hypothetical protein